VLTAHEIFGFMSPALALEIVDYLHASEKDIYRATLQGVAEAKKVRPLFLERKPRAERHREMVEALTKPRLDFVALNVLQTWLLKKQAPLLVDFLDALGIAHKNGMVDDLPATMADDKLKSAVDHVLAKYQREHVAVYLCAFNDLNEAKWPTLTEMLDKDERLQLGA
jgi:hypothetical protein